MFLSMKSYFFDKLSFGLKIRQEIQSKLSEIEAFDFVGKMNSKQVIHLCNRLYEIYGNSKFAIEKLIFTFTFIKNQIKNHVELIDRWPT